MATVLHPSPSAGSLGINDHGSVDGLIGDIYVWGGNPSHGAVPQVFAAERIRGRKVVQLVGAFGRILAVDDEGNVYNIQPDGRKPDGDTSGRRSSLTGLLGAHAEQQMMGMKHEQKAADERECLSKGPARVQSLQDGFPDGVMPLAFSSVASGQSHIIGISKHGQVYAWGDGSQGQVGLGHTFGSGIPEPVRALINKTVVQASIVHKPLMFTSI